MDKGLTLLRSIPAGEQLAHGKGQSREQIGRQIPCLGSRKVHFQPEDSCPAAYLVHSPASCLDECQCMGSKQGPCAILVRV